MERVQLYIDGGNFYHLVLKKLNLTGLDFDFDAFAKFLVGGRTLPEMGKRYYVGTVREKMGDARSKAGCLNKTRSSANSFSPSGR